MALFSFFLPGGLIAVLAWMLPFSTGFREMLPRVVRFYPHAVYAAGLFIGWRFRRCRPVLALLAVAIAERSLYRLASAPSLLERHPLLPEMILGFLAIDLALFAAFRERGFFSFLGIFGFCLINLQIVFGTALVLLERDWLTPLLGRTFFPADHLHNLPLHAPIFWTLAGSGLAILVTCTFRKSALQYGFFWTLFLAVLGYLKTNSIPLHVWYFSSAALILLAAMIEDSYSLAFCDPLTGLPSRRRLEELLAGLGRRYTLAMVDVDHFKKINDRHGHDTGDTVLKMVASKLSRTGGGARVFRYGGEEFTVVFPGKRLDTARPFLEELRKAIESHPFRVRSQNRPRKKPGKPFSGRDRGGVRVTVSIGAAEPAPGRRRPPDVLKAADKALYRAKKSGRNRVCP
jgi:diguanylate cyclase (GGDEF)-like protein